jgi:hypothetical protein
LEEDIKTNGEKPGLLKEKIDVMKEKRAHEKEALTLGLIFLDKNFSGSLEHEEVASLSEELFKKVGFRCLLGELRVDLTLFVSNLTNRLTRTGTERFPAKNSTNIWFQPRARSRVCTNVNPKNKPI